MSNLPGMKEITRYCNRSESTILKWIRVCGFPAVKILGSWESDKDLIDKWRQNQIESNISKNSKVKRLRQKNW